MGLRTGLAIAAGRASQVILEKVFRRGSTLPGRIALMIDPGALRHLTRGYTIVVVTGTNGKTLTTALTVGILREAFGHVITNPSGANMASGIAGVFLKAQSSHDGGARTTGVDTRRFAVLEIDEASLPKIAEQITPDLFVFTNIFRDQMDRYGEIYTTYQFIVDGAAKAPKATVLLNGDSPLFHSKPLVNPVEYYGFDHATHQPRRAHYNTEGVVCPQCHGIVEYTLNTYANLGRYACPNCGFARPVLNYTLTDLTEITNTNSRFVVDGHEYAINVGGLYNIYNALAAIAVAEHLGASPEAIERGFTKSRAVFGRQETFNVGGTKATIVLIKNPVGANQALAMMELAPYPFTLVTLLNANYADGIDTSWIWDADFEATRSMPVDRVIVGGVRHAEMARRYRVAGFAPGQITECESLTDVLAQIKRSGSEHVYILATYTAMLQMRELLAHEGLVTKEMA